MSTKGTEQSGFSAILSIVAIVLVIGVAGLIAWRLYGQPSAKTNDATSNNTNTSKTTVNNPNPTPTTPQPTYLDIKELGIKIQLDDSIKDAIYSYSAPTSQTYTTFGGGAYISTQTLTNKDAACSSSRGPLGAIAKITGNTDSSGNTMKADNVTVFKLGSNYYRYEAPQTPCSDISNVNSLASNQKAVFQEDFKTIQLDQ